MSDNKKYYYIRLKENFFDSDEIKLLESIPNDGYKFSNILLKMYLKSLKYNGRLMFNERIPFSPEMLATVTGHSIGDVNRAIEMFKQFGLIEVLETGEIYMLDIQNFIGKTSTEADRIKAYRREIAQKKIKGVQMYDERTPEIEIEIEKEIDIEIEKERELETGHPAPAAYGRYHNVILSDTELDGLKTELPGKWEYYIDRLSCHIASSGRKYKSHAATIFKWAQEDAAKKAPKKGIPDYTCKEGESL